MTTQKKPLSIGVLLVVLVVLWWLQREQSPQPDAPPRGGPPASRTPAGADSGVAAIEAAFRQKRSGVWVEAAGEIVHILPDDRHPPRHQLFLVELPGGHTVKISHNVDLAPKAPVRKGRQIAFRGRFEHNAKGGVVHWTHHDPGGRTQGGWLRYEGRTYE